MWYTGVHSGTSLEIDEVSYATYWSRRIYAWARTKHFGCHSVCHNGKSLSGHQT